MRICLLFRSEKGSEGVSNQTSPRPDPSAYVDSSVHQIESREIGRETAVEDIERLTQEGFDVFFNYLFQYDTYDRGWIEASRHLKAKSLPFVGAFSDSLSESLINDLERQDGIAPEILAPGSKAILTLPPLTLSNSNVASRPREYTVLVVLIGREGVALTPLEYKAAQENGFHQDEAGADVADPTSTKTAPASEPTLQLIQDSVLATRLQAVATASFNAVRGDDYLAYLRVNLRVDNISGNISVLGASPSASFFLSPGSGGGKNSDLGPDDLVIAKTFPGGHAAFFEVLLSSQLAGVPDFARRNEGCARQHDKAAHVYYKVLDSTNVTANRLGHLVGVYDYDGTILDCCSGSGAFARYVVDSRTAPHARFSALDYSVKMTELPDSQALYTHQPVLLGPVQEVLMRAETHDHVVCFGSFHLLRSFDFVSALSQLFLRARRSVTFDIDDLSQTYIDGSAAAAGEQPWEKLDFNHNNVAAALRFGIPLGWGAVVYSQRRFAYHSPLMKEDVYTYSFRFERF